MPMADTAEIERPTDAIRLGPARSLLLADPGKFWVVEAGRLDLFATPVDEAGEPTENGRFLCAIEPGFAAFGIPPEIRDDGFRVALRATAPTGTRIVEADRAVAIKAANSERLVEQVERWVIAMGEGLAGSDVRTDVLAEPPGPQALEAGTRIGAPREVVLWLTVRSGELRFLGNAGGRAGPESPPLAIAEPCWAAAVEASEIVARPTAEFAGDPAFPAALDQIASIFLKLATEDLVRLRTAEEERIERKLRISAGLFSQSLGRVAGVLDQRAVPAAGEATGDPLFNAARRVAASLYVDLKPLIGRAPEGDGGERLDAMCRAARINLRKVALAGDWYRQDNGPLLGFRAGEGDAAVPVALLPVGTSAYDLVHPETGARIRVGRKQAEAILPTAYMFYRSLPDEPATVLKLMRFGVRGMRADIWRVLAMGLLAGLLGLVTPLISEPLFGDILPRSDVSSLGAVVLAMAMSTLGVTAFGIVRSFSLLRLQGRMEATLQSAIWDRLLRLPTGFFRQYTIGDLADRVTNITTIRSVLTSTVNSAILDGIFALVSFCLLFYYSWRLAIVATILAAVAVAITVVLSILQIPHQRALMRELGKVGGMTYQMLVAVAKLRVAGAEARAFARWAGLFAEQKTHVYKARRIAAVQAVVAQSFPPIASLAIYAAVIMLGTGEGDGNTVPLLTMGAYMAFSAAFGQFLAPLMSVVSALTTVVTIVPMYERVAPILKTVPETRARAEPPGKLTGDIEFRRVTFRYLADSPPVLDDVSWQVKPGEYVAFVGPSGGGKSTVLRLLLGFEEPERGSVFFDHKDLATLDFAEVRRQIGVVMQSAGLISGSIYENIVGSLPLTMDDAWEAARMAGFDEDVRAMPMGMQTVLSESAPSLSGGQRQRLIIARALVRKPRILVFDEATSALDNRTQSIVNDSLDQLNMTRIVVAHRLSTIRGVARIYVLRDGRIVESGGYDELIQAGGAFAQLAKRQIA
jgi:NHLM bacteriocin system ABC transporter ATP-binding protein